MKQNKSSSLAKGYDPLYSSSPLASLDGFSRSHGDSLYVMQLVVAATNQNGLYKKHMLCRENVNKIKMRKIVSPARFDSIKKFVRLAATLFVRGDTAYYNLESIFREFKWKEMKASRRLAENDIITRGVTVKIQQVAVCGNYENPSSDAKGEDE